MIKSYDIKVAIFFRLLLLLLMCMCVCVTDAAEFSTFKSRMSIILTPALYFTLILALVVCYVVNFWLER